MYEELNLPTIEGSLLDAKESIIIQQVNCQGKMNAGLGKSIRYFYPEVYKEYKELCDGTVDKKSLLGGIQIVEVDDGYVINVFSQLFYGRDPSVTYTDYKAMQRALKNVKIFADKIDSNVAVPYGFGAGLANGDWGKITHILNYFLGERVVLYKLPN